MIVALQDFLVLDLMNTIIAATTAMVVTSAKATIVKTVMRESVGCSSISRVGPGVDTGPRVDTGPGVDSDSWVDTGPWVGTGSAVWGQYTMVDLRLLLFPNWSLLRNSFLLLLTISLVQD